MHSSRMHTTHSLPYGGRGSLSRGGLCLGVSVQEFLCPGQSLSRRISVLGGLCPRGLCPGGSLSRGPLSRGVSVQRSLCPGGLCPGVSLPRGSLSREGLPDRDPFPLVNRITDTCKNITLPQVR